MTRDVLVVAIAVVGCAAADRDRRTATPIATARVQAIGSRLMREGVVTVAPRTFDDGFALQDASGGIYVARALDLAIAVCPWRQRARSARRRLSSRNSLACPGSAR